MKTGSYNAWDPGHDVGKWTGMRTTVAIRAAAMVDARLVQERASAAVPAMIHEGIQDQTAQRIRPSA
jgi:hypothetical protein